jgi:beta-glucosidase
MPSYTGLDGVPVTADPALLTDWLRGACGFTGTVVSDYRAVVFLATLHAVAADPGDAAGQALAAGVDVELPTVDCYGAPLMAAVEAGRVDPALVDRAAARVLEQKCELGLLDPGRAPRPPGDGPGALDGGGPGSLDGERSRALARQIAQESIVLLANNGILPLAPGQKLAVVGPQADKIQAMFGCYAFPNHVGVHHPDLPPGIEVPTVLDALRAEYSVTYAQGCPVLGGDDAGLAEAASVARAADACVAVLGDRAGLFGGGTSGEGCDAASLRLPGRQQELLDALLATGTPVILVLLVGRPYELPRATGLAAAVCAFFPGEEGGTALADVLSGRVNPSGRLPVSFPAPGASQPATYLAPALGQRNGNSTIDPTPAFPFGHGLSYAPAAWLGAGCSPGTWPTDGICRVEVTLRNGAPIATTEVVQVYLHDPVAEVARPVQQLIAAARVDLAPGETRAVAMDLHADLTSYTGRAGCRQVDPGEAELRVGASSADIRAALAVTLTGPRRLVGHDRVLFPVVTLLPHGPDGGG